MHPLTVLVASPQTSATGLAVSRVDISMEPILARPGQRVKIGTGDSDTRRTMDFLSRHFQHGLGPDPHAADLNVFRGNRDDLCETWWLPAQVTSHYFKLLELNRQTSYRVINQTPNCKSRHLPLCYDQLRDFKGFLYRLRRRTEAHAD